MLPSLGALSLGAPTGADDDSDNDDEPLTSRSQRLGLVRPPPIYTLEPDPFSIIANELAKRLLPNDDAVAYTDAHVLCARVHQACRELATLNRLPGQAIDPKYDCSDPNAEVWRAALVIFGMDPSLPVGVSRPHRPRNTTWKGYFRSLCRVFHPETLYYDLDEEQDGTQWVAYSLWGALCQVPDPMWHWPIPLEFRGAIDSPENQAKMAAMRFDLRRPVRRSGRVHRKWLIRYAPQVRDAIEWILEHMRRSWHVAEQRVLKWDNESSDSDGEKAGWWGDIYHGPPPHLIVPEDVYFERMFDLVALDRLLKTLRAQAIFVRKNPGIPNTL